MLNHSPRHQYGGNHFPGRRPRSPPTIALRPGQVIFRIICHDSIVGGVIGLSGSGISPIRRDTGCLIHFEDSVPGSEHRIIFVVGSGSVGRRILLKPGEGEDGEEVEETVSGPQEAVLRVVERMWETNAKRDGGGRGVVSEGYCGLLADTSQIGAVVGKKGRNITRMRRESGAEIRMLPAPPCAAKDDELIQIAGSVLAAKKALVAVTGCLQVCPPSGTDEMSSIRPVEKDSNRDSFDPHAEFFPHLSSLLPTLNANIENAGKYSLPSELDMDSNQTPKSTQKTVSFRLLCSNSAAGSIIGKKGSIIRTLQNGTGASISFDAPMANSSERVVTITASENIQSSHSPAQNAVVLVFARSVEHDIEKRHLSGMIKGATVTARLLVGAEVVCCLSGNGDSVDSEMTETTGADVQILEGDPVLDCGFENDVVVQIAGEYNCVQNALFQVTGKLRDNILPGEMLSEMQAKSPYVRQRQITSPGLQQSASLSVDSSEETGLTKQMDQLWLADSVNYPPSPGQCSPKKLGKSLSTAITDDVSSTTTFDKNQELAWPPAKIAGSVLAVKNALVAVTGCLQVCPPSGTDEMPSIRHVEKDSHRDSFDPHAEFFPHLSSLLPTLNANVENAGKYSLPSELDMDSNQTPKSTQKTVSFRLLCSNSAAGSIIGRKGSIVRTLQNGTGASIIFYAPISNSSERVVTITASENIESSHSPAQNAVVLVFARSIEHDIEKRHLSGMMEGTTVTARLLVGVEAVCCLSGNGDSIDSEMTETTGADVQILEGDPVLDCGFENHVVVQITGGYNSVQNALFQVTGKLRDNFLPGEKLSEMRARSPYVRQRQITSPRLQQSAGLSVDSSEETGLTKQMDQLWLADSRNDPPSPGLSSPKKLGKSLSTTFEGSQGLERTLHFLLPREVRREVGHAQTIGEGNAIATVDSERDTTPVGETAELDSGKKSIIVANTTLELIVSEDIIGSVFGEDGSKLASFSQISGAKMEVRDPSSGSKEKIVTISGKPNQTKVAESLLRAFVLVASNDNSTFLTSYSNG